MSENVNHFKRVRGLILAGGVVMFLVGLGGLLAGASYVIPVVLMVVGATDVLAGLLIRPRAAHPQGRK